jgi:hypothetical protein
MPVLDPEPQHSAAASGREAGTSATAGAIRVSRHRAMATLCRHVDGRGSPGSPLGGDVEGASPPSGVSSRSTAVEMNRITAEH